MKQIESWIKASESLALPGVASMSADHIVWMGLGSTTISRRIWKSVFLARFSMSSRRSLEHLGKIALGRIPVVHPR